MRHILTNASGVDTMQITTEGNVVTEVVNLVPPADGPPITAETLQRDLALYMRNGDRTIESAMNAYFGTYDSLRREGE